MSNPMTIPDIHADVARCRDAASRTSDSIQRGQWFGVAHLHLPALLAERDACVADLERWDAAFASPMTADKRGACEDWWIARLRELEAVLATLDALDGLIPDPVASSAPRRAYDDAQIVTSEVRV